MPVPLLGLATVLIDVVVVLALIAALIGVAGIIKDFLAEDLVDILVDVPRFEYSFRDGREDGGIIYHAYRDQRDVIVWVLATTGMVSWLATGRFGHHISARLLPEKIRRIDAVHHIMRPDTTQVEISGGEYASVDVGKDADGGWFRQWVSGLPSRCALFIILLFLLPPVWDVAVDGSGRAAATILNPAYSGNPDYPCPREWYAADGTLDYANPDVLEHRQRSMWLLAQDRSGDPGAMCQPELKVRYMLEQWGGQTKAIPPPLDTDTFWSTITSAGEGVGDYVMRGIGELFVNVVLGVIKAQAVVMTGTAMVVSNAVVDVAVGTMIIFAPAYFALSVVPWERIGGGGIRRVITTYGPATLAAAVLYPIEVAVLFAISADLMVTMLLSGYGNDLLLVWLFGTSIMSMVVAVPIVSLGAFAGVTQQVVGKFTAMIQTAQGGMGAAAGGLGLRGGGVAGAAAGKAGGGVAGGGIAGGGKKP